MGRCWERKGKEGGGRKGEGRCGRENFFTASIILSKCASFFFKLGMYNVIFCNRSLLHLHTTMCGYNTTQVHVGMLVPSVLTLFVFV